MNAVTLPPDLERIAAGAVATGRYRELAEVVSAGVSLLRKREVQCAALHASIMAAQAEGENDGFLTAEALLAGVDARLARDAVAPD